MLPDRKLARAIILVTADEFEYPAAELTGEARQRDLSKARNVAMAAVRQATELSWGDIAIVFNKATAAARWAVNRVEDDPVLRGQRDAIIAKARAQLGMEPT